MPGIFRLSDLEERKKALVAESEAYRQLLKIEAQNLRFYTVRARRKFVAAGSLFGLFRFAMPFAGSWLHKRRSSRLGLVMKAFAVWRLCRRASVALQHVFKRKQTRSEFRSGAAEERFRTARI